MSVSFGYPQRSFLRSRGNKYRDPQLENEQRVRDLGILSPKGDVSTSSFQSSGHCIEEDRKACKSPWSWKTLRNKVFGHSRIDAHMNSQVPWQHAQGLRKSKPDGVPVLPWGSRCKLPFSTSKIPSADTCLQMKS